MASGSKTWTIYSTGSAILAGILAKKVIATTWKTATGKTPPANPAHPDVSFNEALAWAAFSGVAIQTARMLAGRKAASYYTRSAGHRPPGMEKDDA